jgi:site-specific recombinase XerC
MRERGLTEHSLNQVHRVLDRALRHAVQWGLIVRNPAVLVFAPRPRRREMTALSAEELMRLLDHARETGSALSLWSWVRPGFESGRHWGSGGKTSTWSLVGS